MLGNTVGIKYTDGVGLLGPSYELMLISQHMLIPMQQHVTFMLTSLAEFAPIVFLGAKSETRLYVWDDSNVFSD